MGESLLEPVRFKNLLAFGPVAVYPASEGIGGQWREGAAGVETVVLPSLTCP